MQNNIDTFFRYLLYLSCIAVCLVWLYSRHETSQATARAALQAVLDRDQLVFEVDQLSARLEALIEAEKAKLPIHHSHYMQSAPPAVFGSIEWQADIRVKIQYLRWQIEFLITLRSLEGGKTPGGRGQPMGKIIGEPNK